MTTTPSPELPDLDRLDPCPFCGGPARFESSAMWIDLICDHDKACVLDSDAAEMSYQHAAGSLEAMVAKWNRRAQPEGEAPQAVPLIWYDAKSVIDTGLLYGTTRALTIMGSSEKFGDYTTPLFPAAQHAESGAQAMEADILARELDAAAEAAQGQRLYGLLVRASLAVRALAAQSQGAQAVLLQEQAATMLTQREKIQALETALAARSVEAQAASDMRSQMICIAVNDPDELDGGRAQDGMRAVVRLKLIIERARAALAAKAEAPERPECQAEPGAWSECQMRTIELYATLQGPKFAAQQAAAPGALAIEQWRLKGTNGPWYDVTAEDKDATLGTHNGYERRTVYAAPSAPGTPEAPADDALLLRTVVENGLQLHFEGHGEDDAVWVDHLMKWSDGDRLGATRALIAEAAKQRAAQPDAAPEAPKGGA